MKIKWYIQDGTHKTKMTKKTHAIDPRWPEQTLCGRQVPTGCWESEDEVDCKHCQKKVIT